MLSEQRVERYELLGELATGGMATVYLGRQRGPFGFSRTVAIKSMHPQYARDEGFRAMFLDEATLTAKIRHPNVVPTLDIVCAETKVLLVMEYVEGASLSTIFRLITRRGGSLPARIAVGILCDVLHGLHAAHELHDDDGRPLSVVHRDVSPQNIHVGVDGLARVLDFGVAKAATRRYVTQGGEVKGKLAYMSSEQLNGAQVDRRTDIYAAGVVLWEALTVRRLFDAASEGELVKNVLEGQIDPPSFFADEPLPEALDRVVLRALSRNPDDRFSTAEEMARALAEVMPPAPRSEVAALVKELAGPELESRAHRLRSKPVAKALEPEAKALLTVLTEHATATSLSASRSVAATPRSRAVTVLGGLLALAVFSGGAFFVGSQSARDSKQVGAPPAPVSVAPASPVTDLPPPTSTTAAPPSADPTTSASTTGAIAPRPSTATKPPRKPPHSTHAPSQPKSPPRNCNPPFTVDAQGDRHYKPECVE